MAGCCTSALPTVTPASNNMENTPAGKPSAFTASARITATSSLVPGCAGCAFTTTGQPAASAEAVSPPATENASGKLLAPKTATGPSGRSIERKSGRGSGCRSGSAGSIRACTHEPSSTTPANRRNWPVVRPTSPSSRGMGSAVSRCARAASVSFAASSPSAMRRSSAARALPLVCANMSNASAASVAAPSTSSIVAEQYAGSSASPVCGLNAVKVVAPRAPRPAPINENPVSSVITCDYPASAR